MIHYLKNNQINREKWDKCINQSVNACVYVYSWYLDAVCLNWSALILNDYEAVFPLAHKSKYFINYLYQPFFTRYLGVYAKTTISETIVNTFFAAIPDKIKFIDFNIHEINKLERSDFQTKERFFQFILLNQTYEDICYNYKGDAKRNIKKALKSNLKIVNNIAPEKIVNLFKKNKGKQLKTIRPSDYLLLQNVMYAANKNDCGISLGVYNISNSLIAAAFFIKSDNRILFLKGSSDNEGKISGAMYLIIDTMLKNYAQKADIFDFGGSFIDNIASFNHNFGAKNCVYLQVKKNKLPLIVQQISGKK